MVRALVLDTPLTAEDATMLAERHRLGLDRKDEMWVGALHVVPPPFARHQDLEAALLIALRGAGAVLIVDRDSLAVALYTAAGSAESAADGSVAIDPLGVTLAIGHDALVVEGVTTEL